MVRLFIRKISNNNAFNNAFVFCIQSSTFAYAAVMRSATMACRSQSVLIRAVKI